MLDLAVAATLGIMLADIELGKSSPADTMMLLGALAGWVFGFALFRWVRTRTQGYANWKAYKAQLPRSVKAIEATIIGIFTIAVFAGLLIALRLPGVLPEGRHHGLGLLILSVYFISVAPAMLLANLAIWAVPALRAANLAAMKDLPVSFSSANWGLLKMAGVVIPIALAQAAFAMLGSWQ